jgi:arsenate reductase
MVLQPLNKDLSLPAKIDYVSNLQIFGVKSSQETRAAERFFKERRLEFHFVDLKVRPMAPGEIRRFIERFGMSALLDTDANAYTDAGLKYLTLSDSDLLARIEREPKLLKLPLVRSGKLLSIGRDENTWKTMLDSSK